MEGIGGFSQSLARGTEGLGEQVQASRELNERKRQFEDQKKISLAAQGFITDAQGNIVENPDSPVSKARALEMRRVQAEIAKIAGETPSPEMKATRERGAAVEVADMETRAEQNRLTLEGEKGADYYNKAPGAKLRGLEAGVRGQELQNEQLSTELEFQTETKGLRKRQMGANVAATEANTVAAKEGAKLSAAQRRNMPAEAARRDKELGIQQQQADTQAFVAAAGVVNQVFQSRQGNAELGLRRAELLSKIVLSGNDSVTSVEQFLTQQLTERNGGMAPTPQEVAEIRKTASLFAPDVLSAFDLAAGIMDSDPNSQDFIGQELESMLGLLEQAGSIPPERQGLLKQRFRKMAEAMGLAADIYADPVPTSQPTSQPAGAKAPGLPKSKVSPISLVREKMSAPKAPVTDGALKFPVMPMEPVARAARQEADKAVTTAYGLMDDWHKKRLAEAAGASNVSEVVSILNKKNKGHWAKGPNSEIVALPWSGVFAGYSIPSMTHGYSTEVSRPIKSEDIDRLAGPSYAAHFQKMVRDSRMGIKPTDNPADPEVAKKVVIDFLGAFKK